MFLSSTETFIAWRYLRAARGMGIISLTTVFALVGVFLGVATLIVVTSVMNGFREELFSRILGFTAEASVSMPGGKIQNLPQLIETLEQDKDVRASAPIIESQALLSAHGNSSGVLLRGMNAESLEHKPKLAASLSAEARRAFEAGTGVLVGDQLARRFTIEEGDEVTLLVPQGLSTAFGALPNLEHVQVVGLFKTEIYEYDNGFVLLPLARAQSLLGYQQSVDTIELRLSSPDLAASVQQRLQAILPPQYALRTWQNIHGSLHEALIVERNVMFLILTLIVLIASFNIVSGQVMLVYDKRESIAVLRSMGFSPNALLRIFLSIGCAIGFFGTFCGALAGLVIAARVASIERFVERLFGVKLFPFDVYSLPSLPSRIDAGQVCVIVALSIVVTFLAALYPARRAARLSPVEILRSG